MSCGTIVEKGLNSLNYKTNTSINKYISKDTFELLQKGKTLFPKNKSVEAVEFDGAVRAWLSDICKINTDLAILTPDFLTKVKNINRESKASALRLPIENLLQALLEDYKKLLVDASKVSIYDKPSMISTIGSVFGKQKTYYDKVHEALIDTQKAYVQILMDKLANIDNALKAAKSSEAARLGVPLVTGPEPSQLNKEVAALTARLRSMRPGTGTVGAGAGAGAGAGPGARGGKRKTRRRQTKKKQTKRRRA